MKRKFQIGDIVKINKPDGDSDEIENIGPGWFENMDDLDGEVFEITEESYCDLFGDEDDSGDVRYEGYWFSQDWLTLVNRQYEDAVEENITAAELGMLYV